MTTYDNPLAATYNHTAKNDRANRKGSLTARVLLAAVRDYSEAATIALGENMCATSDDMSHADPTWLDLLSAASAFTHAYGSFVPFGIDVVAKVRNAGEDLGERRVAWFARVADDLEKRLAGETPPIPSTDGLPAPPPPNKRR